MSCFAPLLLLAFALPAGAQAPAPATGGPAQAPPPHISAYLVEERPEGPAAAGGTMAQAIEARMRQRKAAASRALLTGVATAVFLGVGLVALRHRSRVCPRCSARLVQLGDPADAAVDAPADPGTERGELWACPACGELGGHRLAGFLFHRNERCPRCGRAALRSGYTEVEPATYLMYGLVRVDEECAACDYAAAFTRSMPPHQAPPPDWPVSSLRP